MRHDITKMPILHEEKKLPALACTKLGMPDCVNWCAFASEL